MDGKILASLLAIVLVAVAVTAAAIDMTRRETPPSTPRPTATGTELTPVDHLRERLVRCQEMGEAAGDDDDCLAAWAENRRRFLGQAKGN